MSTPDARLPRENPVVEEYAQLASDYDKRWSFYINATTRETVARLSLRPCDLVLDVGCGTGAVLNHLSLSYPQARLFGIDPVPEMLAIARGRLPPRIELREGWAERLPFEDNQFQMVVSCSMFHYLRQPLLALREIYRALRPGGQLTLTDWCDDYLACRICDLYLRLFNRAHFKTYGERECLRLLKETGFTEVRLERYKINWLWGLMTATARKPFA